MRIAFDAAAILGLGSKNRGIGNYSKGQFLAMIEQDKENEYFFFNLYEEDYRLSDELKEKSQLQEFSFYVGENQTLLKKEYQDIIGGIVKRFLEENAIDVFYITSPFENPENSFFKREWFGTVRVVALVYDIIPYIFKEQYLSDAKAFDAYMERIELLRSVDQIQVISKSVKDDLVSYLDFDPNKIRIIWGAVDKRYKEVEISANIKDQLCRKFHINRDFIMCTGGGDGRKNLDRLIRAYGRLSADIRANYQLVIVCKLNADEVKKYQTIAKENHCEEGVVLTNFVTDEELLLLYNLATLMAFPSRYEGFGLPIVEAWACGTPILTADNSSLVQIAGDAGIIVKTDDDTSLTKGLRYALTECDLQEFVRKGQKRLEEFQWEKVAASSIEGICALEAPVKTGDEKRWKVAMFTPLPPIQSGISDYSVDIIRELQSYVDIDVYIDDGYEPEQLFDSEVAIYNHKQFESNALKYDQVIYQMGNSTYHIYMYPYLKKHRGMIVLHDYNMHDVAVCNAFYLDKQKPDLYQEYLLEDYDRKEVEEYLDALRDKRSTYRIHEMELNGFVTNYAQKLIVHSYEAKKKLLEKNIGIPCRQIWSYAKVGEFQMENREMKKKYGLSEDSIVIAAFGHVHPTKRVLPILEAFAQIVDTEGRLQLLFAGKMTEDPEFQNAVQETLKQRRIADRVKITGYIGLDEFKEYMDLSDICLNLRYPYNGETSGSLMRMFAKGKCVIVNDIGSFSEFPDDVCIKIPSVEDMSEKEEIQKIKKALLNVIGHKETQEKISRNAYRFAAEHLDIKKIAKEYYEFIRKKQYAQLTEEDLEQIAIQTSTDEERRRIAKTLQYVM